MTNNPIKFVGAGPGDPELITVKGSRALQQADLIIYAGSLVPDAVLHWAGHDARRISSADMHLEDIVDAMTQAHFNGLQVVRLHSGDPSLYGAIFEQISALEKTRVPFEIIPGVTAAFAAAASLQIEYTLPEICQTLILTRAQGRTPVPDSEHLQSLASHKAAMAIYLSSGLAEQVQPILQEAYGPRARAAIVHRASHPDEKIIRTTVSDLAWQMQEHGIKGQALIIIGAALEDSPQRPASRLYDPQFTHGFRKGRQED